MKARKRFGQNFLHDPGIIRRIIDTMHLNGSDAVVEIGPGRGALTEYLVASGCDLLVIEIDRDLVEILASQYGDRLRIISEDVLKFDFSTLDQPRRVIGNLPYNISTPLLFRLFHNLDVVSDGLFMLQDEVVNRLVAAPGSSDYGRLSVMAQYHCDFTKEFTVPPGAFKPTPKVTSAIVSMQPHPPEQLRCHDVRQLETIVTAAFGQRRKTIRNAMKAYLTAAQLESLGLDPGSRPETLSVADYVACANLLAAA